MLSINITIVIPLLIALFLPYLSKKKLPFHIGWFVLAVPIILFIIISSYIPSVASGETYLYTIEWIPTYGIHFTTYLDGLSMIFGLLITGIGSLVILYSIYYLSSKESLHTFYVYLLLFMTAMLGVVFSENLFVLYVFWELTSISSFLLIAFWYHRKGSRNGAQKALLITVSGGFSMLTGFIMLYSMTASASIREIIASIDQYIGHPLFVPALILILIGAFTKSAQFPFHIWLPDAMEAPTPVSAYLHSATMVKAGIYLVARFTPVFGGEALWFWLVSCVGLITMFWGSFRAIRQTDLKALLAFSTVSQLGLIMSLLGLGSIAYHLGVEEESVLFTLATFAALFHLINHSTFKGALFMIVGIVDHQLGTRDIRRLGGLMSFMPISFTVAIAGSFSMAGLPPFNGFLSKEMFFTSVLNINQLDLLSLDTWGILFPIIAWVGSILTFVYCMIFVFKTFAGNYQENKLEHEAHEAPIGMLISPVILAVLVIGIFLFPNIVGKYIITPAMLSVFPTFTPTLDLGQTISYWHGWKLEIWMTIGVIAFGTFLYIFFQKWKGVYSLFSPKWSFNTLYDNLLEKSEARSFHLTKFYMTGYLRDYLVYIFLFLIVVTGGIFLYTDAFLFDMSGDAPVRGYEWIIVLVMLIAGVSILFAKSRVTAILLNSVLGYMVAVLFVVFRAPDLALTQLVVETISTVLFLLCYHFLPEWKKGKTERKTKFTNMVISISVGSLFILIALAVNSESLFETISRYFEGAYELAGGKNIVNVILGDFRAFDTMLEVVVLFIAGIGVYSLIKRRTIKGEENLEDQ
ncbi:Na+/H+ antiporter subunit A [Lederbergia galactosidilytica]|uniref:Cation:proton antiporter n=1 Tax=Lederbergia galactosidilytica TaxID=217031 RepID=A0A177ZNU7_9BACI|nr:Na+/H+ antiporter subunit A [Lederbergia galactosidilytica]KRG14860.1 cation:proton antiporter [Virgibacillus soli]MBP1914536.1 multicomponent Na+:H+ antiporter subunit A [Lederbergia galactosidilytica]OAK69109.1 cation:proton antiporter [Lederbergia galactosidilytica]